MKMFCLGALLTSTSNGENKKNFMTCIRNLRKKNMKKLVKFLLLFSVSILVVKNFITKPFAQVQYIQNSIAIFLV